ncbi:hypothetical protein CVT24_010678 [Panaeolus cyanescens]|uniref:Methyltransferase domain-containing protein n=1 Tax=Panaeolus cyanescens TaxID=181874 RepID=A0A409YM61_9AGAR|nr:hypothetical protein CVT24_010678 [Panaeolus cyanescens]
MDPPPSSTDRPRFHRSSTTTATSTTVVSPISPPQPQRVSSVDSLHHSHSYHALRKRHSAYALSQSDRGHQQLPPVPDLPNIPLNMLNQHHQGPQRPPRNPARTGTHMSDVPPLRKVASRSRPSTASDAREDITPWEFQSLIKDDVRQRRDSFPSPSPSSSAHPPPHIKQSSAAPSMKSHASSLGLSIHTGPISEVTPWELYPVPPVQSNLSAVSTRTSLSMGSARSEPSVDVGGQTFVSREHSASISSINIPATLGPQQNTDSTQITRTMSGLGRSNGTESGVSSGQPGTPVIHNSAASLPPRTPLHSAHIITGPVEDVTPWELEPGPSSAVSPPSKSESDHHQERTSIHKYTRLRSSVSSASRPSNASKTSVNQPPSVPPPLPHTQNRQNPQPQSPSRKSMTRSETSISHSSGMVPSNHWTYASQTPSSGTRPLPTGPAEDVTPWELEPGPSTKKPTVDESEAPPSIGHLQSVHARNSMSLTTAQLEEVTPWELYPVPGDPLQIERKIAGASSGNSEQAGGSTVKNKRTFFFFNYHYYPSLEKLIFTDYVLYISISPRFQYRPLPHLCGIIKRLFMSIFRRHSRKRSNSTPTNPNVPTTHSPDFAVNDPSTSSSGASTYSHSPSNSYHNLHLNPYPPTSFRQHRTMGYSWRSAFKTTKSTSSLRPSSLHSPGPQTRSSTTSTNVPKSLADFGLRRRRSTGTKGRSSTGTSGSGGVTGQGIAGGPSPLSAGSSRGISSGDIPASPTHIGAPSSIVATSSTSSSVPGSIALGGSIEGHSGPVPLAPTSSMSSIPSVTSSHGSPSEIQNGLKSPPASNTMRFSTADRTILQELKATIQAREAHFVMKGVGAPVVGGGKSKGKKHHCYPVKEAPYPRSYEREVIDLDIWEIMFGYDASKSYTWHVFETPPTKVLELGCGTGTWVLQCARQWKDTHFVGLDIVPLQPNLQNVGSLDLASRITWVQHNFLEGLPFPNEEFDFVHIKRIALGVPEDKWDALFEEVTRVMKPGGAFELIEEDLFFPGKPVESDEPSPVDSPVSSRHDSLTSDTPHQTGFDSSLPPPSPSTSSLKTSGTDTVPSSPVNSRNSGRHLEDVGEERTLSSPVPPSSSHHSVAPSLVPSSTSTVFTTPSRQGNGRTPPPPKSAARPTLSVKTQHGSDPGSEAMNGYGSSLSVFGVMAYQPDPMLESVLKQRGRSSSTMTGASSASPNSASGLISPGGGLGDGGSSMYMKKTKPSPFLLRTLTKAPNNPRNHSVLAAIWDGMLGARFINTTPLSLLPATLEYHFKDVRTHPPLVTTFPPTIPKPKKSADHDDWDLEDDLDDARDAVIPRSNRRSSSRAPRSPTSGASAEDEEDPTFVSLHGLLSHSSPFISLDDDRMVAFSHHIKAQLPTIQAENDPSPLVAARPSVLPNKTLNIDLRALNMHLLMRVKEILESSESMWEWVQEFQASHASAPRSSLRAPPSIAGSSAPSRHRAGSIESSVFGGNRNSLDLSTNQILELTREDFDILLSNFELDMQDKIGINHIIEDRFNWHVFTSPELQDRKVFDTTCEKYDNWVAEQRAKEASAAAHAQSRSSTGTHRPMGSISTTGTVPTPDTITRKSSTGHNYVMDDASIKPKRTSTASTLYPTPNPAQMMSRAMRVFVAWKPDN